MKNELAGLDNGIDFNKELSKLSGGQRRKVELAACKCVVNKKKGPCLLLLDEPTTGLDRCSAKKFFEALKDLLRDESVRNRLCVVLATHVPHFVEEVFDDFDVFGVCRDRNGVDVTGKDGENATGKGSAEDADGKDEEKDTRIYISVKK